jgi:hypothetical protein
VVVLVVALPSVALQEKKSVGFTTAVSHAPSD